MRQRILAVAVLAAALATVVVVYAANETRCSIGQTITWFCRADQVCGSAYPGECKERY